MASPNLWLTPLAAEQQSLQNFPGGGIVTGPNLNLGVGAASITQKTAVGQYNDPLFERAHLGLMVAQYTMTGSEVGAANGSGGGGDVIGIGLIPAGCYVVPHLSYVVCSSAQTSAQIVLGDLDPTVVPAASMVTGVYYTIASIGTSSFTASGSSYNVVGTQFLFNGTAVTGTGTVTQAYNSRYSGSIAVATNTIIAFLATGGTPAVTSPGQLSPYEVGGNPTVGYNASLTTAGAFGTITGCVNDAMLTATFNQSFTAVAGATLTFWVVLALNQ